MRQFSTQVSATSSKSLSLAPLSPVTSHGGGATYICNDAGVTEGACLEPHQENRMPPCSCISQASSQLQMAKARAPILPSPRKPRNLDIGAWVSKQHLSAKSLDTLQDHRTLIHSPVAKQPRLYGLRPSPLPITRHLLDKRPLPRHYPRSVFASVDRQTQDCITTTALQLSRAVRPFTLIGPCKHK